MVQQRRAYRKFREGIKDRRRVAKGEFRRDKVPYPLSPIVDHKFPLDEDEYYDPTPSVEYLPQEDVAYIGKQKKGTHTHDKYLKNSMIFLCFP